MLLALGQVVTMREEAADRFSDFVSLSADNPASTSRT